MSEEPFRRKFPALQNPDPERSFKSLTDYIDKTPVQVVMVSEISRLGRRVVDVVNFVERSMILT